MGARVVRVAPAAGDPLDRAWLLPGHESSRGLYGAHLNRGKAVVNGELPRTRFDIVIVGEEAALAREAPVPRFATLDISWFGRSGPYAHWQGTDLIAQALAGLMHPVGPAEGPPAFLGTHQATTLGGVAAYCAGVAALLAGGVQAEVLEVSILESIIILSELQMCHSDRLGETVPRVGVNRFVPTCPLSIHRCKEGWIGITPINPAQWQAFCRMLDLPELADDVSLRVPKARLARVTELEAAFDEKFPQRTALEWGALGREFKVPMVVVPDAEGVLEHPIFNARESFAFFTRGEQRFKVPRSPLRLTNTPPRGELDEIAEAPASAEVPAIAGAGGGDRSAPLADVRLVDFSMGWAGPLATRILSDLGAEVIKIEAGRYPDWWRSVDWSPQAIADKQYEQSRHFSALNRGKKSVSIDLTSPRGKALAKALVQAADVGVENQAAGVLDRLGLGFDVLSSGRDDLIMMSMSAFGAGNDWSETRAYGSVLEQGSGLPSFSGQPDGPPAMSHLAYGDPVGGIYGAASLLTALYHRQQSGRGQWINNTQIEAMLPFTTPAVLARQAIGREPPRLGNRHPNFVPHGSFRCVGEDRWLALAVDDLAWPAFARLVSRDDWASDADLTCVANRRAIEDEIERAVTQWTRGQDAVRAAAALQSAGVAAAAVAHMDEVTQDPQLCSCEFFYRIERPFVGRQLQAGLPVARAGGQRFPMRGLAPFLGADSRDVLSRDAAVNDAAFQGLLDEGIVSLEPTQLRTR